MATLNKGLKDLLSSDMQSTVNKVQQNNDFSRSNGAIEKSLKSLLLPYFPLVEMYTFGSRELGVATNNSDLDIYIDTDGTYHTLGFDKNIDDRFDTVHQLLSRSKQWKDVYVVNAKVPLIQAYHKGEQVNCDISLSDGMGHCNTELVQFFCEIQPIMRDMIIYMKLWLEEANLSNHIKNYTMTLLIINFLQHKRFLPSIKALQEDIRKPAKIGSWIVEFDRDINHLDLQTSDDLEEMMSDFFKFFSSASKFDYIICTYLGVLAPKNYFNKPGIKSLKRYFTFINEYENENYKFSPMMVQGPFNLTENPAKQVSKSTLHEFVTLCGKSYIYLNSN